MRVFVRMRCSLESRLQRKIEAGLVARNAGNRREDAADIEIGGYDRDVARRRPGDERIPRGALVVGTEIVWLAAVLRANGDLARQQVTDRSTDFRRVAIFAIAAKSEQAELVRLRIAQLEIEQQALVQQHFGRRNVEVGAVFVVRAELL